MVIELAMSDKHSSYLLVGTSGLLTLLALWFYFIRPRTDPREPPLLPTPVPFLGHAIGMLRHGFSYYSSIPSKTSAPICTLDFYVTKIYVVNSANIVSAVQRNAKVLSIEPLLTAAVEQMVGMQGEGLNILREEHNGGHGINTKTSLGMRPALLGDGLNAMNNAMISNLYGAIQGLAGGGKKVVDLRAWCQETVTNASSRAVWGSKNPLESAQLQKDFWTFESNMSILVLKLLPKFTAPTAFRARESVIRSFVNYYNAGGQHDASELASKRWQTQHDAGLKTEDIARDEVAISIGLLSNTYPAAYWTIFEIYSRPDLLALIRGEVSQNALCVDPPSRLHSVDLGRIRDSCPKLLSVFQEMLRVRSHGSVTRFVYKDVMLNDQYLLKEGALLQIPPVVIHNERSKWGPDASVFDPLRFDPAIQNERRREKPRSSWFVPFGASPSLCPGRHFATGEVLALTAMLVLRYDMVPIAGHWWSPGLQTSSVAASVTPPKGEYPVTVMEREEYLGSSWNFKVTEGRGLFGLVTG